MLTLVFFIAILYWIVLKPQGKNLVNRYITICSFLFFAIIAFRSEAIYGDTYGYVYQFRHLSKMSLTHVLEIFDKDRFFWVISYYISVIFNGNYTLWLAIIALVIILPLVKLIRTYSLEPMYSFVILVYLGLVFFFMAGLRQTVAIAFVLIGALALLDNNRSTKNRIILYSLCVLIAYLFHGSSFIAISALLFINRPLNRSAIFFYCLVLLCCLASGRYLMSNVIGYMGQFDTRYLGYAEDMSGATYTYFFQQLVLILPSLIFLKKYRYKQPIAMLFHFSIIGCV